MITYTSMLDSKNYDFGLMKNFEEEMHGYASPEMPLLLTLKPTQG